MSNYNCENLTTGSRIDYGLGFKGGLQGKYGKYYGFIKTTPTLLYYWITLGWVATSLYKLYLDLITCKTAPVRVPCVSAV